MDAITAVTATTALDGSNVVVGIDAMGAYTTLQDPLAQNYKAFLFAMSGGSFIEDVSVEIAPGAAAAEIVFERIIFARNSANPANRRATRGAVGVLLPVLPAADQPYLG